MRTRKRRTGALAGLLAALAAVIALAGLVAVPAQAAYHHMGEIDSDFFLEVYPDAAGTKLDSCTTCHSGGTYINDKGKPVTLGSCQWCHEAYGYDASGDILDTLNPYGADYLAAGRDAAAVAAIAAHDSDGDGFVNVDEVAALRYPGDADDDPTKVAAPSRVYNLAGIEALAAHTQFLLMNTHKSGDWYGEFTGVPMEDLLGDAGMLESATGIQVYAPDGFATYHPLDPTTGFYHVRGLYPQSVFYYDEEADVALTPYGWCSYDAPSCPGRQNGDPIVNAAGDVMLLAYKLEGEYLTPGVLNDQNKLDGDGPFRVVPPQWNPGPPDQASTSPIQDVIWPFDGAELTTDHNAGFSTRSATIVKVEPLPAGTTDIDTMEAGWDYVDEGKVVVYGAIDPLPTVQTRAEELAVYVVALERGDFKSKRADRVFSRKLTVLRGMLDRGNVGAATDKITDDLLPKVDGFAASGAADWNDWIRTDSEQRHVYWALQEMLTLLAIE